MTPELWAEKDRRITRVAIAKSIIESLKGAPDPFLLTVIRDYADFWFNWVYEQGQDSTPQSAMQPQSAGTTTSKPQMSERQHVGADARSAPQSESEQSAPQPTTVKKPFTRLQLNGKVVALTETLGWTEDTMRKHLRSKAVGLGYQAAAKMEKPSELMSDTELAEVILDLDALLDPVTPADKDFQETFGESN